jgi:hypothetical protein
VHWILVRYALMIWYPHICLISWSDNYRNEPT